MILTGLERRVYIFLLHLSSPHSQHCIFTIYCLFSSNYVCILCKFFCRKSTRSMRIDIHVCLFAFIDFTYKTAGRGFLHSPLVIMCMASYHINQRQHLYALQYQHFRMSITLKCGLGLNLAYLLVQ